MRPAGQKIRNAHGALIRLAAVANDAATPDVQAQLYRIPRGETPRAQASSNASRVRWSRPEERARYSAHQKKLWEDPEHRARLTAAREAKVRGKKFRQTMRRRCWENLAVREKQQQGALAAWESFTYRDAITQARKRQWADPEYRARMLGVLARARAKKKEMTS